jgi:chitin synthase
MHGSVLDLFKFNAGRDITKQLDRLNIDSTILACQKVCLRNLFLVGKVDNRQSPQCLFANNIFLALLAIMVAIISFKNLGSINFSAAGAPEDYDRFDIC